ncbi:MAG: cation diffusion facilitator family transporter [Steroidobacteraceae bacterium]
MSEIPLARYAWLSIAAALATMALKTAAWWLTGSVGLLSDALESLVNLAGALMALAMLSIAARPPDDDHAYGHGKAEYFSAGVEGGLIVIAAASIAVAAVDRLLHPRALEQVGLGLAVSVVASAVNLGVALVLLRAAKERHSVTLRANAHHLLTDVWTSAGVLAGVLAVAVTGWERLDPIVALVVAANIVWTGWRIMADSVAGLMDASLPPDEIVAIERVLAGYAGDGIEFHALRTRRAGAQRFVSVHVLVPPAWTVQRGHDLLEHIESDVRAALPPVTVFTHLEPIGDPRAMDANDLHRDLI